ncbi:MAG: hypothetical protein ABI651_10985 [Verrucomicrobiota bacterium]
MPGPLRQEGSQPRDVTRTDIVERLLPGILVRESKDNRQQKPGAWLMTDRHSSSGLHLPEDLKSGNLEPV